MRQRWHLWKRLYDLYAKYASRGEAAGAGEAPLPRITWTPRYREAFNRLLTGSSPSNVSGLWSMERAQAFAAAQLPRLQ